MSYCQGCANADAIAKQRSMEADQLRADLAAERAAHEQQLAKVCEERDHLVNAIEFMRGYKGIEARGCVLCVYENGVFKKRCQMHSDLDRIKKERDGLAAMLAKVKGGLDG